MLIHVGRIGRGKVAWLDDGLREDGESRTARSAGSARTAGSARRPGVYAGRKRVGVSERQGARRPDRGSPRLLDLLRSQLRMRHRSSSTERSYVGWVKRFVYFHELKHPRDMGKAEIEAFLNHLAVDLGVAASTQNQALNALVFLYRHVLGTEVG